MFDFSLIVSYVVLTILEYTLSGPSALTLITLFDIIVVVLTFLKINFFLRIYDGFSFLVSMVSGVFNDISFFLLFFLIFIVEFGVIFIILFRGEAQDGYDGIGTIGYFLMVFRISSGDFAVDNYKD